MEPSTSSSSPQSTADGANNRQVCDTSTSENKILNTIINGRQVQYSELASSLDRIEQSLAWSQMIQATLPQDLRDTIETSLGSLKLTGLVEEEPQNALIRGTSTEDYSTPDLRDGALSTAIGQDLYVDANSDDGPRVFHTPKPRYRR